MKHIKHWHFTQRCLPNPPFIDFFSTNCMMPHIFSHIMNSWPKKSLNILFSVFEILCALIVKYHALMKQTYLSVTLILLTVSCFLCLLLHCTFCTRFSFLRKIANLIVFYWLIRQLPISVQCLLCCLLLVCYITSLAEITNNQQVRPDATLLKYNASGVTV